MRGDIEALGPDDARAYMRAVRGRSAEAIALRGAGDGSVCEMVIRHELQHSETMRQTMALAGLLRRLASHALGPLAGADEWIEVPAGSFATGADADGFAYDNERPRHTVELPAFEIARRPVTNASWALCEREHERARVVADEGWSWKEEYDITTSLSCGHPDAPVCHVSWFQAASTPSPGARLPSEAEWERAATSGLLSWRRGQVWEWTASAFGGYPGFVAHPYKEYSEVFFGDRYRVLRGGSWATSPRVKTATFRNWDLPQRRQIFAGVRLARDVP